MPDMYFAFTLTTQIARVQKNQCETTSASRGKPSFYDVKRKQLEKASLEEKV